ncbi:MAG: AMP-binding protein, partial [Ilumatobacteraceae bacterium]
MSGAEMRFRDAVDPAVAREYREAGWWGDVTLVDHLRRHCTERGDQLAYVSDRGTLTWVELDRASDRVASVVCSLGIQPGERAAMLLPDSGTVHAVMLGLEKAGVVNVGLGARAGVREIAHLLTTTDATTLIVADHHRDLSPDELRTRLTELGVTLERVVQVPALEEDLEAAFTVDGEHVDDGPAPDIDGRRIR